jgi:NAD+ synthase (glutamine-hydrolysing)
LCLPELCITGYGCEDAFHSPGVQATATEALAEVLPATKGIIVSLGLPLLHRGGLFNTACLVADGNILGFVGKKHLAGEGLHYEPRWFKPWPAGVRVQCELAGGQYPLGDLLFDCGGVRLGFEICEDAWVAGRPGADLARRGVDIILNPSASHFAFGKHDVRTRFVLDGSRAFHVCYVYANMLGNEAGRAIYDGDAMIASCGKTLASGPRFSFADCQLTTAVVDVDESRMSRTRSGSSSAEVESDPLACVRAPFAFPACEPVMQGNETEPWERSEHRKEEEFTRALALGLFDYLRKSRSSGFVVSLSGGADSAAVATLSACMVRLGTNTIGRTEFLRKLRHVGTLSSARTEREMVRQLLTCVYQPTRNSSQTTRNAARQVATTLGAEFLELDVDEVVEKYVGMVQQAIGRELDWQQDDLALQNIQARARAPSVWLLANLRGALLLSTSNRSEAAVGYATMDGDTSGGLSPIAGIDKAFLLHWLEWMEKQGPCGLGPTPELAVVNAQAPTAELRPRAAAQTDEQDLMPYKVLDAIERAAIRDKLTPLEVFRRIEVQFTDVGRDQLGAWVERFFRLWCRNQWKRERYAPCFHLDDENLDPKTWCRFPILSGGYERELRELRAYLQQQSNISHRTTNT